MREVTRERKLFSTETKIPSSASVYLLSAGKGNVARGVEYKSKCGEWNVFLFFFTTAYTAYRRNSHPKNKIFSPRARSTLSSVSFRYAYTRFPPRNHLSVPSRNGKNLMGNQKVERQEERRRSYSLCFLFYEKNT